MKTGFRGTFVISWTQTEIDGLAAAPTHALDVGAVWLWRGDAVRVDGPSELLCLEPAEEEKNARKRAARVVRRLIGAAMSPQTRLADVEIEERLQDRSFVVTDGAQSYIVTMIDVDPTSPPLLMFLDGMPPRDRELWVVHHTLDVGQSAASGEQNGGVICFTPGTMITTPNGARAIETLRPGDFVQTKDSGPQEVVWIGARRMTGARLFAMPHLRPIRIRSHALGGQRPEQELIVSPEHRMLVDGPAARALFNTSEVLVSAKDLVNGGSVAVDYALREVTYVHLMLASHQILWANGLETESFHPANTALSALGDEDRARLLEIAPEVEVDPNTYGHYARRNLNASEAAILSHRAA